MRALILLLFVSNSIQAQISSTLIQRLCNSWKMEKMDNNGVITKQPGAPGDFKLFIKSDSTLLQGLYPEGLIPSHWMVDEKKMTFTIIDDKTSMRYELKIIRITNEEFVLQDLSSPESLIIYYKRED